MMREQAHCCDEAANHQLPIAATFWINLNSFLEGMFKLNIKLDTDSLLYFLSHFECDGHTVHMLTQHCLLVPLTSTVKSSLFTHVHSSPLSLAARLHRCHASCSCYINNGWSFSGQTSYFYIYLYILDIFICLYTYIFHRLHYLIFHTWYNFLSNYVSCWVCYSNLCLSGI